MTTTFSTEFGPSGSVLGLSIDAVDAQLIADGRQHLAAWRPSWARSIGRVGAMSREALVGAPLIVHGALAWGPEQRDRARLLAVGDEARGRVVARAMICGWASVIDGQVRVMGRRPSWAPDDPRTLLEQWPGDGDVIVLDDVEPIEPVVTMGDPRGLWKVAPALLAQIAGEAPAATMATKVQPKPRPALRTPGPQLVRRNRKPTRAARDLRDVVQGLLPAGFMAEASDITVSMRGPNGRCVRTFVREMPEPQLRTAIADAARRGR